MSNPLDSLPQFFRELRRRSVYQVGITYLVAGFVVVQLADLAAGAFGLPPWFQPLVWVLCGLGFPIALILAWAFERTPEGVRRTVSSLDRADDSSHPQRALIWGLVLFSGILLAGGGMWYASSADTSADPPASLDTPLAGAPQSPEPGNPPRIAVLPFEDIAADSGNAFFAQGMHEEVISQLAKVSALEVISRTSVMQYARTDKSVLEISEELGGVDALLEGSVRRAGGRVLITIQLIDVSRDAHLWSETYERELSVEELFEIQADIASNISVALQAEMTEGERQRIEDVPTSDLAAYDAYLRGEDQRRRYLSSRSPDDLDASVEGFREAIRRDSTFVEAYAGLANSFANWYNFGGRNPQWLDSASVYADRAQELDPNSIRALGVQSYIYRQRGSSDAAEEAAERALALDPNAPVADDFSDIAAGRGDVVEAVRWAYRAIRRSPRSPWLLFEMGDRLERVGMEEAAEAWYRHVLEIEPSSYPATTALLDLYLIRGESENARAILESYRSRFPDLADDLALAAFVALHEGNPEEARRNLMMLARARHEASEEDSTSGRNLDSFLSEGERVALAMAEIHLGQQTQGYEILRSVAESLEPTIARDESGSTPLLSGVLAGIYWVLGEEDNALRYLDQVSGNGVFTLRFVSRNNPWLFEDLSQEPRFQDLVRQADAREREIQEEIRRMDIDLYPPGADLNAVD